MTQLQYNPMIMYFFVLLTTVCQLTAEAPSNDALSMPASYTISQSCLASLGKVSEVKRSALHPCPFNDKSCDNNLQLLRDANMLEDDELRVKKLGEAVNVLEGTGNPRGCTWAQCAIALFYKDVAQAHRFKEAEELALVADKNAFTWFKHAADAECNIGLYYCGQCYEEGVGVATDLDKALKYYKGAYDKYSIEAKYSLARLHAHGVSDVLQKDLNIARALLDEYLDCAPSVQYEEGARTLRASIEKGA